MLNRIQLAPGKFVQTTIENSYALLQNLAIIINKNIFDLNKNKRQIMTLV